MVNNPWNRKEGNPTIKKSRHGDFIGGIEHGGGGAAGQHRLTGQPVTRVAILVDGSKIEGESLIERKTVVGAIRCTFGIEQRV